MRLNIEFFDESQILRLSSERNVNNYLITKIILTITIYEQNIYSTIK